MGTRYRRARDFEYRVRDDMSRHGWIAIRSPASKSPVDVYCIGFHECVMIQCKTNGRLGTEEWNAVYDMARSVDALPVLAQTGPGGRGICYHVLTGRKEVRGVRPMDDWEPPDGGVRREETE
jgi:Holliday junction resolvase